MVIAYEYQVRTAIMVKLNHNIDYATAQVKADPNDAQIHFLHRVAKSKK